ncbi:hypothetical protein ATCC90586_001724 [Pythium insidiosum]|nr:hypothetical protein ATCC90586_001724 [Pythium insidiosum]
MEQTRRLRAIGFRRGRYQSKFVARHAPKTRRSRPVHRGQVWESLFMRKSKAEKQAIIQRPWELPMAAQHLSAILIQKRVRGMLCRLRLARGQRSALTLTRRASSRRQFQSPMQRFVQTANGAFGDEIGFRRFAATMIQAWYRKEVQRWRYKLQRFPAWYRKEVQRWRYKLQRFPVFHIAALQIQYTWKAHCQHRLYKYHGVSPRVRAALIIQAAWKRHTNRRIYRYYRDLLTFRSTGDPALMLRAINPSEAALLDASMGAHVRFRLGGMSFPPTIYYKIFTRKAVCDLNAFSPKNYALDRQRRDPRDRDSHAATRRLYIRVGGAYFQARRRLEDTRDWYRRVERNGWRPVTAKVMAEANSDPIAQATAKKTVPSSHLHARLVSRHDVELQRRLKKRQWMQKLYTQGLLKPTQSKDRPSPEEEGDSVDVDFDGDDWEREADAIVDVDFDGDDWEREADAMFEWATALDFDDYVEEWQELGCTAATDEARHLV